MVMLTVMESEGRKIMMQLMAMDVSVWSVARECRVSYQTAKAWKRGWWNPDASNTHKLFALLITEQKNRGIFK